MFFYSSLILPIDAFHFEGYKIFDLQGDKSGKPDVFYAPTSIDQGHMVFGPSVCLCVHLFVRKNFYIGHIFWLVRLRAFIFHMSIPCDKTFLLVPSSRSSVKVKYQGHSFKKNGHCGGH